MQLMNSSLYFLKFCLGNDVPIDSQYREFESYADVINQSGGLIGAHHFLLKKYANQVKDDIPSYSRFSAQLNAAKT